MPLFDPYFATGRRLQVGLVIAGAIAGVVSPIITWSTLQRAPLWRTIVEPLACAVAASAAAVVLGLPVLVLLLPPAGLALGFLNLRRRYPANQERIAPRSANKRLESTGHE